ncbi:MAG: hypothetical protein BGO27_07500 [Alphaproteobacteria bacterium 33-17]|nr:MAG: hypothetical protein BGO27_07500 [Alphaproteobacteria bacterium 33-17]
MKVLKSLDCNKYEKTLENTQSFFEQNISLFDNDKSQTFISLYIPELNVDYLKQNISHQELALKLNKTIKYIERNFYNFSEIQKTYYVNKFTADLINVSEDIKNLDILKHHFIKLSMLIHYFSPVDLSSRESIENYVNNSYISLEYFIFTKFRLSILVSKLPDYYQNNYYYLKVKDGDLNGISYTDKTLIFFDWLIQHKTLDDKTVKALEFSNHDYHPIYHFLNIHNIASIGDYNLRIHHNNDETHPNWYTPLNRYYYHTRLITYFPRMKVFGNFVESLFASPKTESIKNTINGLQNNDHNFQSLFLYKDLASKHFGVEVSVDNMMNNILSEFDISKSPENNAWIGILFRHFNDFGVDLKQDIYKALISTGNDYRVKALDLSLYIMVNDNTENIQLFIDRDADFKKELAIHLIKLIHNKNCHQNIYENLHQFRELLFSHSINIFDHFNNNRDSRYIFPLVDIMESLQNNLLVSNILSRFSDADIKNMFGRYDRGEISYLPVYNARIRKLLKEYCNDDNNVILKFLAKSNNHSYLELAQEILQINVENILEVLRSFNDDILLNFLTVWANDKNPQANTLEIYSIIDDRILLLLDKSSSKKAIDKILELYLQNKLTTEKLAEKIGSVSITAQNLSYIFNKLQTDKNEIDNNIELLLLLSELMKKPKPIYIEAFANINLPVEEKNNYFKIFVHKGNSNEISKSVKTLLLNSSDILKNDKWLTDYIIPSDKNDLPNEHLKNKTKIFGKIADWSLFVLEFAISYKYWPGRLNIQCVITYAIFSIINHAYFSYKYENVANSAPKPQIIKHVSSALSCGLSRLFYRSDFRLKSEVDINVVRIQNL